MQSTVRSNKPQSEENNFMEYFQLSEYRYEYKDKQDIIKDAKRRTNNSVFFANI